jgi:hypothetical protein
MIQLLGGYGMVTIWILFGTFLFVFGLIEVVSNALDYFLERACRVYPYGSDKNPQRVVVLSELRDGDMFMGNPKYPCQETGNPKYPCQELPQYSASIGMDNPEYPGVYVVSLGGLVSMNGTTWDNMGSGWVVDGYRPIDKEKLLAALNSGKFDKS